MIVVLLAELGDELQQQGGRRGAETALQQSGRTAERRTQLREVARPRRAQRDSRHDSFQVADGLERLRDGRVPSLVDQRRDRVIAGAQRVAIAQRPVQPAAQHAAAHGGGGAIEDTGQGEFGLSGQALVELQIAARRGVHDQRGIALFGRDRQQVRQRRFLRFANVGEQGAGRCNAQRFVGAAETGEIAGAKLFGRARASRIRHRSARAPAAARADLSAPGGGSAGCAPSGARSSAGRSRSISASSAASSAELHDAEAARRQVEPGEPVAAHLRRKHAGEEVVAPLLQQRLIGDGARRHDAHHLALHRTLGLARLAALLADRHRFALAHQLCQIGIERDRRHARHGNRRAGGGAALGERDVEQLRGAARIVVEHFVEIAHAIEQQHVRDAAP